MAVINALAWPLRLLAVGLVTAGLGGGVYFLAQAGGSGNHPLALAGTPTMALTPETPASTPPTPTATEAAPTALPLTATPDLRVPIRTLPTVDQIQLGSDGKYFIADRGDGCRWEEIHRDTYPSVGVEVVFGTDCRADFNFVFRPESGEVLVQMP